MWLKGNTRVTIVFLTLETNKRANWKLAMANKTTMVKEQGKGKINQLSTTLPKSYIFKQHVPSYDHKNWVHTMICREFHWQSTSNTIGLKDRAFSILNFILSIAFFIKKKLLQRQTSDIRSDKYLKNFKHIWLFYIRTMPALIRQLLQMTILTYEELHVHKVDT